MNQSVVRMTQRRILIVEDEQDIAELVALHLDDVCDEVVIANDGNEGMRLATSQDWSLIILTGQHRFDNPVSQIWIERIN